MSYSIRLIPAFFVSVVSIAIIGFLPNTPVRAADHYLDLSKLANRAFVDDVPGDGKGGWSDQGAENSLRGMKAGPKDFENFHFTIIDGGKNAGREVLVFTSSHGTTNLREVEIPVGATAPANGGALYLLHTTCWASPKESEKVGVVTVRFASGKTLEFPVATKRDVADWWNAADFENGLVGYREENKSSLVGVYISRFPIPAGMGKPEAVTLKTEGGPIWIVLAATLSDKDQPLPKREVWKSVADENWKPVNQSDLEVKAGTALDMSALFGAPSEAGRDGFSEINSRGELVFAKKADQPVRFFCLSTVMGSYPNFSSEEIERFAQQASRAGYNLCRPHFLDIFLMKDSAKDLDFNPKQLDRWDRLSAALKKQGIYFYIDASTSWAAYYAMANPWGKESHAKLLKSRLYYDEAARAHWKAGVKKFFEHVNPYTGVALKDEPQVAVVQLRNEAGLNFLMNLPNSFDPGMVVPFRKWLAKRYGTTEKLAAAWTASENGKTVCALTKGQTLETVALPPMNGRGPDTRDLQQFFVEIERETYIWLARTIREIGVKVPVFDYNVGTSVQTTLARDVMPLVDNHSYHDHPTTYIEPGSSEGGGNAISTGLGFYQILAGTRQWGRPYLCSEWGYCFWNSYRHQTGLTVPVYAALQGWQMQAHFSDPVLLSTVRPIKTFCIYNDPALKAAEYMSAFFYRRGDVQTSPHRVEVFIDPKALPSTFALQDSLPFSVTQLSLITGLGVRVADWSEAAPRGDYRVDWRVVPEGGEAITVREGVQEVKGGGPGAGGKSLIAKLKSLGVLSAENRTDVEKGFYESDTRQVTLDQEARQIRVVTPQSEGANLPEGMPLVQLGALSVRNLGDAGMTVFIGSLKSQPVKESSRLLLIVAADALNSGMVFDDHYRHKLLQLGTQPVLARVARMEFRLQHRNPARLKLWALSATGERREELPLKVDKDSVTALIDTGKLKDGPTPYFELAE
ncbi:MAG: hypothetical protein B9S32_02750 [Verrucomicrobia bacterium Tous-C9LFEB]|nr:MAG: hypothetical protein B9S32_02750 [Verrucomicrobia bacterium Tous-C9LFEB]